jgi:predicted DNA-binding transcriptional regulator AlpA
MRAKERRCGMKSSTPLPEAGFLRLRQVLQLYPVSKSTWWAGIAKGIYPQGVKLSARTTAWHSDAIRELIENGPNLPDDEVA